MQPRVHIVGAGVAGLSLATCLRARNIPYHIFDSAPSPKAHTYGLTLTTEAYEPLASKLDPKLNARSFERAVAVDRLAGRTGKLTSSDATSSDFRQSTRVQDSALRTLLAQQHPISWSHRLTSAQRTSAGSQLRFENGQVATAPVTVDATGERSVVISQFLHPVAPEVLPYAVYHGSRYVEESQYHETYGGLFEGVTSVAEFAVPVLTLTSSSSKSGSADSTASPSLSTSGSYIQISRAYVNFSELPSSVQEKYAVEEQCSQNTAERVYIEIRYTISRPALLRGDDDDQAHDPLFNPSRTNSEASEIPPQFYDELSALMSPTGDAPSQRTSSAAIPRVLCKLLDTNQVKKDRILNWLLRVRRPRSPTGLTSATDITSRSNSPSSSDKKNEKSIVSDIDHDRDLLELADQQNIIAIGDAAHALPILGSHGACLAMEDANRLANWLSTTGMSSEAHEPIPSLLSRFYIDTDRFSAWAAAEDNSRLWLREVHGQNLNPNPNPT